MKNNIEAIKDVLEAQLSTPIPGTPFHAIKQEKRYLIVLGKNIVCEGKDIEELSENFEKNKWNTIWFMNFTTVNAVNEWNKLSEEDKNILNTESEAQYE